MILLVMGVSGTGKSTLGALLSASLQWPFLEGDDFHPAANVERMSAGKPLRDEDRWPWLDSLRQAMEEKEAAGVSVIVACSALKEEYRARLGANREDVKVVYLTAPEALIAERLTNRQHFFAPSLLASQLETLEPPEDALCLSVEASPESLCQAVLEAFSLKPQESSP